MAIARTVQARRRTNIARRTLRWQTIAVSSGVSAHSLARLFHCALTTMKQRPDDEFIVRPNNTQLCAGHAIPVVMCPQFAPHQHNLVRRQAEQHLLSEVLPHIKMSNSRSQTDRAESNPDL